MILIAASVVPSLLLLWYFVRKDKFPEPPKVIWATFFLGVVIVVPVVPLAMALQELAADGPPLYVAFGSAFLGAAVPEEFCKLMVLLFYCRRHSEFDEPMDGMVYGVAVSLGFATLENILYVSEGGLTIAIVRAVTAVPGHAMLGAIMGFYVGLGHFSARPRHYLWLAFLVPVALHGLYDYPLMLGGILDKTVGVEPVRNMMLMGAAIFVLMVEWWLALRMLRRLKAHQKKYLSP